MDQGVMLYMHGHQDRVILYRLASSCEKSTACLATT